MTSMYFVLYCRLASHEQSGACEDFLILSGWQVSGGGNMKLRSNDTAYLHHVDHWFNIVLPKLAPYARSRGGPIIMVQVLMHCGNVET